MQLKKLKKTRVKIKPLSVNEAWKGKRYRSDSYKKYQIILSILLKWHRIPDGKLTLVVRFGFSSKGSDIDNPLKPLIDCLQKKYMFNDNRIYRLEVEKEDVKKGEDFIEFELIKYTKENKY